MAIACVLFVTALNERIAAPVLALVMFCMSSKFLSISILFLFRFVLFRFVCRVVRKAMGGLT